MKIKWELQPLEHEWTNSKGDRVKSFEQILIKEDSYPFALLHIDSFWQGKDGDNKIYNLLNEGNEIVVEVNFKVI